MFPVTTACNVVHVLLLLATFTIGRATAKGRGGRVSGPDIDVGGAFSSLDLPPALTAAFALTVIIAIITAYQIARAAARFKTPTLPPGTPTLPYQVGKLFPTLLFLYTFIFLVYNILYAVFIALRYSLSRSNVLPPSFIPGMQFAGQLADVFLFAIFLSIIPYRERIQLNPLEPRFNLKTFLDGWTLSVIIILGVTSDAMLGASYTNRALQSGFILRNMDVAYQVFVFIASLDVIMSSIASHIRLQKSGIKDIIIKNTTFFVSPLLFIGTLYRIIRAGLTFSPRSVVLFNFEALFVTDVVIGGLVSIAVVALALAMGAPPKPLKQDFKAASKDTQKA